ncbi:hypothetical protein G6O67_003655 [Ophiocordyceps sinensis]|uniref:Uncharacterized protein n=1 Tax=Ophiocordyceps sinensis TaxID=72228 RepID=A0A8H4PS89_9HYPO|nr:hypothetical protein G6O67_003655 [Ophiocordyceps sinensis]
MTGHAPLSVPRKGPFTAGLGYDDALAQLQHRPQGASRPVEEDAVSAADNGSLGAYRPLRDAAHVSVAIGAGRAFRRLTAHAARALEPEARGADGMRIRVPQTEALDWWLAVGAFAIDRLRAACFSIPSHSGRTAATAPAALVEGQRHATRALGLSGQDTHTALEQSADGADELLSDDARGRLGTEDGLVWTGLLAEHAESVLQERALGTGRHLLGNAPPARHVEPGALDGTPGQLLADAYALLGPGPVGTRRAPDQDAGPAVEVLAGRTRRGLLRDADVAERHVSLAARRPSLLDAVAALEPGPRRADGAAVGHAQPVFKVRVALAHGLGVLHALVARLGRAVGTGRRVAVQGALLAVEDGARGAALDLARRVVAARDDVVQRELGGLPGRGAQDGLAAW